MLKMRRGAKLGLKAAHRKMMLRSMASALVHHEKITITRRRARELKFYVERMISRLKKAESPLERSRLTETYLAPNGYHSSKKVIEILLPRYSAKKGGYLRVTKLPPRKTDQTELARIELLS